MSGVTALHPLPADDHVHSQFSYDRKPGASMLAACQRAVELGLPSVAFTEHLDFASAGAADPISGLAVTIDRPGRWEPLDVESYLASIAECRERFPDLLVRSGVEAGEAHLFAGSLAAVLAGNQFERVLGSCHAVIEGGVLVEIDELFGRLPPDEVIGRYFDEVLRLVEGSSAFEVLAHCDFVRRYLPAAEGPYDEKAWEEQYRAVFRALAPSGRALEVNTKSPLASVEQVRWWYEAGGGAVSFGSDAHQPWLVGAEFGLATAVVEAAGFRPGVDPGDWWRR